MTHHEPWLSDTHGRLGHFNAYITRCQSVLQEGTPHNDVLLYWPVYDLWMNGGNRELRFTVHDPDWIEKTACGEAGHWLIDHGYTFDFVSDRQLLRTRCDKQSLSTEGGNRYRAVLVPAARFMKTQTVRHLLDLAASARQSWSGKTCRTTSQAGGTFRLTATQRRAEQNTRIERSVSATCSARCRPIPAVWRPWEMES